MSGPKLVRAAEAGNLDELEEEISRGANLNYRDTGTGWTALLSASLKGRTAVVQRLLSAGADPTIKDEMCFSPLHVAASRGNLDMIQVLLDFGCKVDSRDLRGATPLHLASQNGHLEIAKRLLEASADITKLDDFDHTPLDRAEDRGHHEVVRLLQARAGAADDRFAPRDYMIKPGRPGLCVIISMEALPRRHARSHGVRDRGILRDTFRRMHFRVLELIDRTREEILTTMQSATEGFMRSACFVCFVLCRGQDGCFLAADEEPVHLEELFSAENFGSRLFRDVPKLVVVNMERGPLARTQIPGPTPSRSGGAASLARRGSTITQPAPRTGPTAAPEVFGTSPPGKPDILRALAFQADVLAMLVELPSTYVGNEPDGPENPEMGFFARTLSSAFDARCAHDDIATILSTVNALLVSELRSRKAPTDVVTSCCTMVLRGLKGRLWFR